MKKINFTILLIMFMSMVCSKLHAYDIAVENDDGVTIYYNLINNKTELSVTFSSLSWHGNNNTGASEGYLDLEKITIPKNVYFNNQNYSVTSIGYSAFSYCSSLTSINIPNSVTSIGSYAFYNNSCLTSVNIPESMTNIGDAAFSGCSSLTSVNIPESVTNIGDAAFSGCSSLPVIDNIRYADTYLVGVSTKKWLSEYQIKEGTRFIGPKAFEDCENLTKIVIPNSVECIGSEAFLKCSDLSLITIPNSVTKIGNDAFKGCYNLPVEKGIMYADTYLVKATNSLTDYTIKSGIRFIGNNAFTNCSKMTSITIPEGVISIGNQAFYKCHSLTFVSIPNSITNIGDSVFHSCNSLTSINIPESVTSLGECTFSGCSSLASVDIPESVTSIGESAFLGCSSLTSVIIPNSLTSIAKWAFCNCSSLTSITIPDGVKSIGWHAFSGCSSLTSINIPNGVTNIGEYAFSGCSSLTSVIIPEGVTQLGNYTFTNCSSLTSVKIPSSLTNIGWRSFVGCSSLEKVSITDIASWCELHFGDHDSNPLFYAHHLFLNDEEIKMLNIPNSVTNIAGYAFSGCSSLTSVTIPNSVSGIGYGAFSGCSNLEKAKITDITAWCKIKFSDHDSNPLFYAHHLFMNDEEIKMLDIPYNITTINDFAFIGCQGLETLTIPQNVTTIGDSAFLECDHMTSLSLSEKLKNIKKGAFYGCRSLKSIVIPSSVVSIYQEAFGNCGFNEVYSQAVKPPFAYDNTFDNYDIPLYVPTASYDSYRQTGPWKKFAELKTLSGETPSTPKCAMPAIHYYQGKLTFNCKTEEAICHSTITDSDIKSYVSNEVQLGVTYNISVYATKAGYENSDVATATLCWIDVEPKTEGITDNIAQIPAHAVLIQSENGEISVVGLDDGTKISVYEVNGMQVGTGISNNGQAVINTHLPSGSIAIVKIGEKSVKVTMK